LANSFKGNGSRDLMKKNRTIILHYHQFKNAGRTFDWILEKNFGKSFSLHSYKDPKKPLSLETVQNFLLKNPSVVAFSSHRLRFPIPQNSMFYFIPVYLNRHPIDRIFSVYNFIKRNKNSKKNFKAVNSTTAEYIKWELDSESQKMKNAQMRFLSLRYGKTSNKKFLRALEVIKNWDIVGIVDRFDECMVYAEHFLGKHFQDLDFSYIKQNVSKERKGNLEERLEQGRLEIGNSLMDKLIEINKLDLKLYDFVNEEFNRRIKKIPNFENKLFDFRERCKKLDPELVTQYKKTIFHAN